MASVWPEDEAAFPRLLLYFSSHCLLFGLKNSVAGADREASHNGHDPPSIRASCKHQAGFSRAAQSFIYARERGFRFSTFFLTTVPTQSATADSTIPAVSKFPRKGSRCCLPSSIRTTAYHHEKTHWPHSGRFWLFGKPDFWTFCPLPGAQETAIIEQLSRVQPYQEVCMFVSFHQLCAADA